MTTTSSKLVEDTVLPRHIRSINFMHGISLAATYIKLAEAARLRRASTAMAPRKKTKNIRTMAFDPMMALPQ